MSLIKYLCATLFCFTTLNAYAAQDFEVNDGDVISIKVSKNSTTRISMTNGKIKSVSGRKEDATIEKGNGEIFLEPNKSNRDFSFLIIDDRGVSYTVMARVVDIPAQTVRITPVGRPMARSDDRYKTDSYIKNIKSLMKAMMRNDIAVSGYGIRNMNVDVPMWEGLELKKIRLYTSNEMNGEVYLLINDTNKHVRIAESEFLSLGENVRAVSIDRLEIGPDQSTYVYIARSQ